MEPKKKQLKNNGLHYQNLERVTHLKINLLRLSLASVSSAKFNLKNSQGKKRSFGPGSRIKWMLLCPLF
jgi:hypothetical protein